MEQKTSHNLIDGQHTEPEAPALATKELSELRLPLAAHAHIDPRVGFEPSASVDNSQVVHSTIRQNRQNRENCGSRVHERYTGARKRAVIYVRVSTSNRTGHGEHRPYDQDPEVQAEPLREMVRQRGWELERVYSDRISGAKERRPGLDQLMIDAKRSRFDVVLVWRFDRFARSAKQMVIALEEFRSLDIDFVSHQEALDTSTPMGKAVFTIIATMAELERSVIRDRVVAGLRHARRHGTKSGRPVGRPRAVFDRAQAFELRRAGWSWRMIARKLDTSATSVRRACESPSNPR